ncbi:MAG: alpha/beta fold hydrolase [Planctomycetia bacterium]|nr:alpha/beta fold hydrolase [Planctomycetia bacterium]
MRLLFKAAGEGLPLVLLHGFPLSAAQWDPNFARLRERHLVVAMNLRGLGGSPAAESATMEEMADDVAETLGALGIARAAVCGCSMGGYVALAMWKRHRERVGALVLADTRAVADSPEQKAGREEFARAVLEGGPAVAAERMMPKLLSAAAPEGTREFVRSLIHANRAQGLAAALRGMGARPDSTPLLETIDVPALLVCGAKDTISTPEEMRGLAARIRGASYVELPGAGHLSNMEAPGAFSDTLTGFFKERA